MAQRDYVRKKPKPIIKPRNVILSNFMVVIAITLVILFSVILYKVSNNKTFKSTPTARTLTEKPQTTLPDKPEERWTYLKELENPESVNPAALSVKKQSNQQNALDNLINNTINNNKNYINNNTNTSSTTNTTTNATINNNSDLSNNTTQSKQNNSETTQTMSSSSTDWLLQCGAFKDIANAESLKAKLAMLGINGYIKSEHFHRILVGPFNSNAEAEKMIEELKRGGIKSCIVTQK